MCSLYRRQKQGAGNKSAGQVLFIVTLLSTILMLICLAGNEALLRLIFGQVDDEVMEASKIYFFYTALSFPFIGIYDSGASIFRAQGNTRCPMAISVISNIMNVCGNAILIWGFEWALPERRLRRLLQGYSVRLRL